MKTTETKETQQATTEMDPIEAMTGDAPTVIIDPAPVPAPAHIGMSPAPTDDSVDAGTAEREPTVIIDTAPISPPPQIDMPTVPDPAEPPAISDPFAYSDIKKIVRVPRGFQCLVKFDRKGDYLSFLACADDVEAHGRAIHKACRSRSDVTDYVPTDAELLAAAQERIATELRRANGQVTIYQDRVDVDRATKHDVAALRAWKSYRVDLNELPGQKGWPTALTWPTAPPLFEVMRIQSGQDRGTRRQG